MPEVARERPLEGRTRLPITGENAGPSESREAEAASRLSSEKTPLRGPQSDRPKTSGAAVTASALTPLLRRTASYIFAPSFLYSVAADTHRTLLHELGVVQSLGATTTILQMYERVYEEMARAYKSEYLYKNEVIRRIFEARHNPDRSTVLLEKPIAQWASRVDLIVLNATTSAYEIKTDHDDLSRVRHQTDLSLKVFDRVFVVCSERLVEDAIKGVDSRVGILALQKNGAFCRVRAAAENAEHIDPVAVFSLLRKSEYIEALASRFGPLTNVDSVSRYATCVSLFADLTPREAHTVLLRSLRKRFIGTGDKEALKSIPYSLAHLYFKANTKERRQLFSAALLERTIG